jgi:anti-sigma regulatory factor (Ser/Thr protein kinase)
MCAERGHRDETPEAPDAAIRSLELPATLSMLSQGRGFVAKAAQDAGFPEDRVFDIALSCSEAIANAIEHGLGKATVGVKVITFPDRLEVRVASAGEFQAPSRAKGPTHRGLGLPLMAKLTDQLTLSSGPEGGTLVSLCFYFIGLIGQ